MSMNAGASNQTRDNVQQDLALAASLIQIIQTAVQAYENATGQPLDPALIRPEAPVP